MSEDHARERFRAMLGNKSDAAYERYRAAYPTDDPSVTLSDATPTFGRLSGRLPAQLILERDALGKPLTNGYAAFGGHRLNAEDMAP